MSAVGGFVTGILGLSLLEAVLSSSQATGRVSGALSGVGVLVERLASPEVPAIPDLRLNVTPSYPAGPPPGSGQKHPDPSPVRLRTRSRFPHTATT